MAIALPNALSTNSILQLRGNGIVKNATASEHLVILFVALGLCSMLFLYLIILWYRKRRILRRIETHDLQIRRILDEAEEKEFGEASQLIIDGLLETKSLEKSINLPKWSRVKWREKKTQLGDVYKTWNREISKKLMELFNKHLTKKLSEIHPHEMNGIAEVIDLFEEMKGIESYITLDLSERTEIGGGNLSVKEVFSEWRRSIVIEVVKLVDSTISRLKMLLERGENLKVLEESITLMTHFTKFREINLVNTSSTQASTPLSERIEKWSNGVLELAIKAFDRELDRLEKEFREVSLRKLIHILDNLLTDAERLWELAEELEAGRLLGGKREEWKSRIEKITRQLMDNH